MALCCYSRMYPDISASCMIAAAAAAIATRLFSRRYPEMSSCIVASVCFSILESCHPFLCQ